MNNEEKGKQEEPFAILVKLPNTTSSHKDLL